MLISIIVIGNKTNKIYSVFCEIRDLILIFSFLLAASSGRLVSDIEVAKAIMTVVILLGFAENNVYIYIESLIMSIPKGYSLFV